jgi:hypothetical protein
MQIELILTLIAIFAQTTTKNKPRKYARRFALAERNEKYHFNNSAIPSPGCRPRLPTDEYAPIAIVRLRFVNRDTRGYAPAIGAQCHVDILWWRRRVCAETVSGPDEMRR